MDKTSLTYSMYSEAFTFFTKLKKDIISNDKFFLVNQVSLESVIEI